MSAKLEQNKDLRERRTKLALIILSNLVSPCEIKAKHRYKTSIINQILNTRRIHRITFYDRSLKGCYLRSITGDSPDQARLSLSPFTRPTCKLVCKLSEVTYLQCDPHSEIKPSRYRKALLHMMSIRLVSNNQVYYYSPEPGPSLVAPKSSGHKSLASEGGGSNPLRKPVSDAAYTTSLDGNSTAALSEGHYVSAINSLLTSCITPKEGVKERVISTFLSYYSITPFYLKYNRLTPSRRDYLDKQGLISQGRRLPGPVNISRLLDTPFLRQLLSFLSDMIVSLRQKFHTCTSTVSKHLGLDYYFIKASNEASGYTSNPMDRHNVAHEWDRIEKITFSNSTPAVVVSDDVVIARNSRLVESSRSRSWKTPVNVTPSGESIVSYDTFRNALINKPLDILWKNMNYVSDMSTTSEICVLRDFVDRIASQDGQRRSSDRVLLILYHKISVHGNPLVRKALNRSSIRRMIRSS